MVRREDFCPILVSPTKTVVVALPSNMRFVKLKGVYEDPVSYIHSFRIFVSVTSS